MSKETVSSGEIYKQMKDTVRQSFSRLYAALQARELQILHQVQALHLQCDASHAHSGACLASVHISYENEANIIADIAHYGELRIDGLNLNSEPFVLEDYVNPKDDQMYYDKDKNKIAKQNDFFYTALLEDAVMKEIAGADKCVCSLHNTSQKSKTFQYDSPEKLVNTVSSDQKLQEKENYKETINKTENSELSDAGLKVKKLNSENNPSIDEKAKINPTEEWLNCIKTQIETEPTQVSDVMEHSMIKNID